MLDSKAESKYPEVPVNGLVPHDAGKLNPFLCDRFLPSCTACARIGVECRGRSPPPNPTLGGAGITQTSFHSYLKFLEQNEASQERSPPTPRDGPRLEALAAPIQRTGPGDARAGSIATSGPSPSHPNNDAAPDDGSSIDDTMGAIGLLTNSAMAEPRHRPRQAPDGLGLLHSVQAALAIDGHDPSTSMSLRPPTVFDGGKHHLPSREDAKVLMRCYLERIHFIPCLALDDDESLGCCLDSIMVAEPPSANGDEAHALRLFDVYMQISIGMMVSSDSIRLSHHSVALQAAAVRLLTDALRSPRHIDTVHCLVLLTAFAMFNPNGGSVWHLLGLALRTCIIAGLHKEPGPQTTLTSQEADESRWLFWSVYVLDRWLGVAMDRPFGIQDRDITVNLPGELENRLSPTRLAKEAFGLHVIRHAQLVSDIRRTGRRDAMFDYSNVCYWRDLASGLHIAPDRSRPYPWREYADQLACRALIQTVSPTLSPHTNPGILLGTPRDVEDDALASCRRFINASYEQTGHGKVSGSFLDAYDVVSAAVVYACLSRRVVASSAPPAELTEVIHKASTLVTQISARFPALGDFHRLFMVLLSKTASDQAFIENCTLTGPPPKLRGSLDCEMPHTMPLRLRRFIEAAFT